MVVTQINAYVEIYLLFKRIPTAAKAINRTINYDESIELP